MGAAPVVSEIDGLLEVGLDRVVLVTDGVEARLSGSEFASAGSGYARSDEAYDQVAKG